MSKLVIQSAAKCLRNGLQIFGEIYNYGDSIDEEVIAKMPRNAVADLESCHDIQLYTAADELGIFSNIKELEARLTSLETLMEALIKSPSWSKRPGRSDKNSQEND